jgi:hypothetical protein
MRKTLLLLALAALSGCATVKPWEKETLGKEYMAFRQDSRDRPFLDHAQITVEQAEGGYGGAGGGCGCR